MALDEIDWTLPLCPTPPDWSVGWEAILAAYPWLHRLADVPQDPVFHVEGDVLTHTRMVVEELAALPEWRALPRTEGAILFAAALLHDIGKPDCTRIEPDGRIVSPGHARTGAAIARRLLWDTTPFVVRETIVALVRLHGLPIWFLDKRDIERTIFAASYRARLDRVALLAEADARGRRCADQDELLARIDLFRDTYRIHHCAEHPYAFPSDHSRVCYFRQQQRDPHYHAYDDSWGEVVVLAGLPGAGKDTWLRTNLADWPVVSLDAIRAARGVAPDDTQGAVVAAAKAQARAFLRQRQSFVWNATNLSRRVRDPLVTLCLSYGARVRIVYCDAPLDEILRRNRRRTTPVPEAVIHRLAAKLDLPDGTEAHTVVHVAA